MIYSLAVKRGFSLIELVAVLVLVTIVSAVAFIAWPKDDFDLSAQAESLASDIRYTQALSVAKNVRHRLDLTNSVQYRILDNTGTAVLIPSVNMTVASFKTGLTHDALINYLVFDGHGTPYSSSTNNGSGSALTTDLVITITSTLGTKQVVVVSETGGVYVQ